MKGLDRIPTLANLQAAYSELQTEEIRLERFATYSQWARFDPRLAEIWVARLIRDWRKINPIELNAKLTTLVWPSAAGVLIEHLKWIPELESDSSRVAAWITLCLNGISTEGETPQLFFVGTSSFAGRRAVEISEQPFPCFLKWGYLLNEWLVNKAAATMSRRTAYHRDARLKNLKGLIQEKRRSGRGITVEDYRRACGFSISIRVAQKDLSESVSLISSGNTRSRVYRLREKKKNGAGERT